MRAGLEGLANPSARTRPTPITSCCGKSGLATAAVAGLSTDGRSAFFQLALLAFGLHSVVHLLQSALVRGYAPGVVTAILGRTPTTARGYERALGPPLARHRRAHWTRPNTV
jgi:hypothetical protein